MMMKIDYQENKTKPHNTIFLNEEHQLEVDTELCKLSSRNLWRILELNKYHDICFDSQFIEDIKTELLERNDFDEGVSWKDPH